MENALLLNAIAVQELIFTGNAICRRRESENTVVSIIQQSTVICEINHRSAVQLFKVVLCKLGVSIVDRATVLLSIRKSNSSQNTCNTKRSLRTQIENAQYYGIKLSFTIHSLELDV